MQQSSHVVNCPKDLSHVIRSFGPRGIFNLIIVRLLHQEEDLGGGRHNLETVPFALDTSTVYTI